MLKKQAPGETILKVGGMLLDRRNAPAFSWRSAGIWKWKHAFSGYEGQ